MDDFTNRESLYRDTLSTASFELGELSREITRLRALLEQLERRREAVAQICEALGTWVELETQAEEDVRIDLDTPIFELPPQGLKLTEEEVSLIAYPRISQRSA